MKLYIYMYVCVYLYYIKMNAFGHLECFLSVKLNLYSGNRDASRSFSSHIPLFLKKGLFPGWTSWESGTWTKQESWAVVSLCLYNKIPLFDLFVFAHPLMAYGHLHSEYSFLSFQNISYNYESCSEYCLLYVHLMCPYDDTSVLFPVQLPTDRIIFHRPALSNFQIEREICVTSVF